MAQLLTVKQIAGQLGPAEVRRGGVQRAQTALCARLSEPGAVRESTRSTPCQNCGLTLSTHRGALKTRTMTREDEPTAVLYPASEVETSVSGPP